MKKKQTYVRADEFFKNAKHNNIIEDVRKDIQKEKEQELLNQELIQKKWNITKKDEKK